MDKDDKTHSGTREPDKNQGLLNILKLIFLAAVLVSAWFVLDWLISRR